MDTRTVLIQRPDNYLLSHRRHSMEELVVGRCSHTVLQGVSVTNCWCMNGWIAGSRDSIRLADASEFIDV